MSDKQTLHRVFFALWPDDHVRQQISAAFQQSPYVHAKGRRYQDSNLHITLHFLGNMTEEQLNCARQQAAAVKLSPFSLNINRFGRFKQAGILWLGPDHVPDELVELHQQLGAALDICGYQPEAREYRPHITLMRKFHDEVGEQVYEPGILPVNWVVDRYALIESVSVDGLVEYRPLHMYSSE